MPGYANAPRPETLALDTWIRAVLSRRDTEWSLAASGSVLFLEPGLHAIPASLIRDAVLEPVDKLAWLVIHQAGTDAGGWGEFPSYKAITATANVGSSATVSRALSVLRLTRWLTQVSRDNLPAWTVPGHVYVLHGAPLALTDTLFLDTAFPDFVRKARTHHHARVRALAEAQCAFLVQQQAQDPCTDGCDIGSSAETETVEQPAMAGTAASKTEALQNSKSRSSKLPVLKTTKKTTTTKTTTTEQRSNSPACEAVTLEGLVLPVRLTPAQYPTVARYLTHVPDRDRQAVLDELAGRLEAEQRGARRVYDALRYLHQLCQRARAGEFVPNLGVAVRNARQAANGITATPPPVPPPRSEDPIDREIAQRALAEIRETLGMSLRVNIPPEDAPKR
jgi:hypothetical protein